MNIKKDLYLAKTLNDLQKLYTVPDIDKLPLKRICTSARKLWDSAEENYRAGDEELSFVFYMKYLNMVTMLRKRKTYQSEKSVISNLLGSNRIHEEALDKAEILHVSLKARYETLNAVKLPPPTISKNLELNVSASKSVIDQFSNLEIEENKNFFTCKTLYEKMMNKSIGLLIFDCRPKEDFLESKLRYDYCINIPEEIILNGMSAGRIKSQLPDEDQTKWSARSVKMHVVLIDWKTNSDDLVLDTPIWKLKSILTDYDPDVEYKSLVFVKGGFEEFILMYPTFCTNPNVRAPTISIPNLYSVEDIEYPNISDIQMKDETIFNDSKKPIIDRSTKAAALKSYGDKNSVNVLEEEEKLADKTLDVEKEILNAETDWKAIQKETEMMTDEETQENVSNKKQQLEFKLMQLNSKKKDIEIEKNDLEVIKQYENDPDTELLEDAEIKRLQILEKREKARRIEEENERLTRERAEKQAIAREKKKPEIPNRAAKPNLGISDIIQRDFSPVIGGHTKGVTGLKNLGNTCYMNSIVQCLSNTTSLVEFLVTGTYRSQINTSSKTKGRMVDELAAAMRELWLGKYKYIAIKDLRLLIGQQQRTFRGSDQQDSHEFLTILIDWLHLDLQSINVKMPSTTLSSSERAWFEFTKQKESYMLRLFYGQIKSTVKCTMCGNESATYETFSNLSLELPPNNSRCEIKNCLDMYFNGEKINGWTCPRCKQKREAIKKLNISRLPSVLVIHFKRFYAYSDSLTSYKKRQNYIDFPITKLNMNQYIAPTELKSGKIGQNNLYNLYAISNHYGSMESGHYTAFGKNFIRGEWFKFDDHIVSQMDISDVKSSAAYILFYTLLPDVPFNF